MIYSMTGYAAGTCDVVGGSLQMELKSVNSRFLDIHFRTADELRGSEPALRELITGRIARGKVECRVNLLQRNRDARQTQLNSEVLQHLRALQEVVRIELPEAAPLSVAEVLRWPGVLGEESSDPEALSQRALVLARQLLDDFVASRQREGEKLKMLILERVVMMRALVTRVEPHLPAAQQAFQDKLRQRLLDAIGAADDERIRQEIAVFANRTDVAEELARLSTHLDEVERVLLKQGGNSAGKRLDFLMQELNREANTLGSKSVVSEVSQISMELKVLIEQVREQVQNLE